VRAVVLAGGLGSRLKPFTFVIPKPLVPIGELPILEIMIRQLKAHGFDRVTLSVGYLSSLIEAYCGDGSRWDVPIDYVREDESLGTAGFLSLLDDLDEDRLLVLNGDILTTFDFGEAVRAHDPAAAATICVRRRPITIEFGVIDADDAGRLTAYTEKPTLSYDVSMGVNVLSRWAIEEFVTEPKRLDMPDLIRAAANAGHVVRVLKTDAPWFDMGSMDDLSAANDAFAADPARFLG
jgi:NDP-sugar pyrophosphorylase family protein